MSLTSRARSTISLRFLAETLCAISAAYFLQAQQQGRLQGRCMLMRCASATYNKP